MVTAPASLSSVTSLSWNVPAVRSTLPLACGDRAKTICMPSSSIARLNCVGCTGAPGAGHVLEDGVPVGVEGDGYAVALYQPPHQQEVVAGVLLLAETGR